MENPWTSDFSGRGRRLEDCESIDEGEGVRIVSGTRRGC